METVGKILAIVLVLVVVALLMAWPTMLLWNWLMPVIFGLKTITFWQAVGLNSLCSILFKSSDYKSKDK